MLIYGPRLSWTGGNPVQLWCLINLIPRTLSVATLLHTARNALWVAKVFLLSIHYVSSEIRNEKPRSPVIGTAFLKKLSGRV